MTNFNKELKYYYKVKNITNKELFKIKDFK